jgi:hypothetical protein
MMISVLLACVTYKAPVLVVGLAAAYQVDVKGSGGIWVGILWWEIILDVFRGLVISVLGIVLLSIFLLSGASHVESERDCAIVWESQWNDLMIVRECNCWSCC